MPTKERWAAMSPEEREKYRLWTANWRERNRARHRELAIRHYRKKNPEIKSVRNRSPEDRAERARIKASNYHSRYKHARFTDELTEFVTKEAHALRRQRDRCTGISWHVDHIIPLAGKTARGLHIWSNLQVIPKLVNLAKGTKEMTKFLL